MSFTKNDLKERFDKHPERHPNVTWAEVETKLDQSALAVLAQMEATGGEPDVVAFPDGRVALVDCCVETSKERRSLCYDKEAWEKRKAHKPAGNVVDTAHAMGAELLSEKDYLYLQTLGDFDLKSQVWIACDPEFRQKGDGLFGNKRHGRTFIYYNGAQSYYANRGFRTIYELK